MEVIFYQDCLHYTQCLWVPSYKLWEVEQVVSGHMYDIEGGPESRSARSANLNSFALDSRG